MGMHNLDGPGLVDRLKRICITALTHKLGKGIFRNPPVIFLRATASLEVLHHYLLSRLAYYMMIKHFLVSENGHLCFLFHTDMR